MMTWFFPDQDIIEIHAEQLAALKLAAAAAPVRRARLCLHHDHADTVQEMVIAFCRDTYNRPHRHRNKSESFHVIEGRLAIVLFDDAGNPTRQVHLGPPGGSLPFLYRLSSDRWHAVLPLSEYVVIHETTTGPFELGQTEFATWSPDGTHHERVRHFLARLEGLLNPPASVNYEDAA